MAITGLTYAEISNISTNLKNYAKTMKTELDSLQKDLNKIGGNDTWSGTAATETKATIDKLSKKFPDFYEAVDNTAKYLDKVVENYKTVDKALKTNQ